MPPRKKKTTATRRKKRRPASHAPMDMEGSGVKDILKGINKFLKKNKVISRGARAITPFVPPQYRGQVRIGGELARQAGYGHCYKKKGSGLTLAGQGKKRKRKCGRKKKGAGLKLAGQGKRKRRK